MMRAAAIVVVFLMVASPGVAQVTRQAAERTERQDAFPQSLQELVAHTSPSHLCNRPGHLLGICRAHSSRGGAPTSEALGESWRSWRARALKKHLSPCERLILSTQRSSRTGHYSNARTHTDPRSGGIMPWNFPKGILLVRSASERVFQIEDSVT